MIKELATQLSEAREDYEHLKADLAAQDARLTAVEHHLSDTESHSDSPLITSPMDVSPSDSSQGSPIINKSTPAPASSTASPIITNQKFDERLDHIDGRYNRMERALGKLTSMISSFTGNSSYDSLDLQ